MSFHEVKKRTLRPIEKPAPAPPRPQPPPEKKLAPEAQEEATPGQMAQAETIKNASDCGAPFYAT